MAYSFQGQTQNSNYPNQNQSYQIPNQQVQPLFPQPQGNVYNINSTLEVANVPVGAGVSVALCMPENVMFIKTMQNGNPLFYPYKIIPFETEAEKPTQSTENNELVNQLKSCCNRLDKIEEKLRIRNKGDEIDL